MTDFRCFNETTFEPDPTGLTVLRGANGAGKTSILEAIGWLATGKSIRGAPREALVRSSADRAILRAEIASDERAVLFEAELPAAGPARVWVNRQPVRRRADLVESIRVSVFSPDDLGLVQGGPAGRRGFLDEALGTSHPRLDATITDVERALRQRSALLRQAGRRITAEIGATLDVWDSRLATSGSLLAEARLALAGSLEPLVTAAYSRLAGQDGEVRLVYKRSWEGELVDALATSRQDDIRRQTTAVGPHRDELELWLGRRPARTHASQGEQRCVALALRLAAHQLATERGPTTPILLLDDVFSELDDQRSAALVKELPPGQVLLTTATDPPAAVTPDMVFSIENGELSCAAGRV